MITVQKGTSRDIGVLADLDLKSYEYPWPTDNWASVLTRDDVVIYTATVGIKPAGFCVVECKASELVMLRFGVIPKFRRMQVATMLRCEVYKLANSLRVDKISILIPEIHCLPGHPDDVSELLGRSAFRATEVVKDCFLMYGGQVDGYKFVKELV